jgi:RNA polymerase sigma factor (sigma-70 family)
MSYKHSRSGVRQNYQEPLEEREEEHLGEDLNDLSAFTDAFNDMRGELVSTLFFVLGDHDQARRAAEMAFERCCRARAALPEIRDFRAWIFRVGLGAARELQRESRGPAEANQEIRVEGKEDLDSLRRAVMELNPDEKAVFLLRENGRLSYDEIARHQQSSVGRVKRLMHAALDKLTRVLKSDRAKFDHTP